MSNTKQDDNLEDQHRRLLEAQAEEKAADELDAVIDAVRALKNPCTEVGPKTSAFEAPRTRATMDAVVCKPGRFVLDPQGRRVEIVKVEGDNITVKLYGSYAARVTLPRSTLRNDD